MAPNYSIITQIALPGFADDTNGVDMASYEHLTVRRDDLDRWAPTLAACADVCVELMSKKPATTRAAPMCMSKAVDTLWTRWGEERSALGLEADTPDARARMTTLLSVYVMHGAGYRQNLVASISVMDGRCKRK